MAAEGERRRRLLQLASGAAFLVIVGVAALIVASGTGTGAGGDTHLEGRAAVDSLLAGIPQEGMALGDRGAPVALIEFGDLQCPFCRHYAEAVLPPIIENQVKNGRAKIEFRNSTIIGEQSTPAGAAALAAGAQGRGWSYVELFYRNQGEENSGYADDAFLRAIAKGAGVPNLARWERERRMLVPEVEQTTAEAQQLGFTGTPSFALEGPRSREPEPIGTPEDTGALEEAIEAAR
ncbi:MAG TPA: thioredoxin domain-containing protein [Solirubrobacterales bacterium]|nr:thioredoxin domain-containing protein [Solirubrobacterales bacterium]